MSAISGASDPSAASSGGRGVRALVDPEDGQAAARDHRGGDQSDRQQATARTARRCFAWNRRGAARPGHEPGGTIPQPGAEVKSSAPGRSMAGYQSNFTPKRHSRGGMIVVGCRKFVAEPQLMFWAAFVFVRL